MSRPPVPRGSAGLIVALAVVSSIGPLATDMYLPAFPAMAGQLNTSASGVQLTLTAFLIGFGVGQFIIGPLSDVRGRRGLLLIGMSVCAVGGAAAAMGGNVAVVVAARFVQGLGGAAGPVLSRAIISDIAHGTRAARLYGAMMTVQGLSPVVAPLLGAVLVPWVGWRGVLWTTAGFSAVMLMVSALVIPETLGRGDADSAPRARRVVASVASVLTNVRFLGFAGVVGFGYALLFAYISASSFVLQNVLGMSASVFGIVFAVISAMIAAASALASRLSGRIRVFTVLMIGLVVQAAGAGAAFMLVLGGSGYWLVVALAVTLFGFGMVFPTATSLALAHTPASAGSGSAAIGVVQSIASAAAAPLVGLAGEFTALPMVLVMVIAAAASVPLALVAHRGTADWGSGQQRFGRRARGHIEDGGHSQ